MSEGEEELIDVDDDDAAAIDRAPVAYEVLGTEEVDADAPHLLAAASSSSEPVDLRGELTRHHYLHIAGVRRDDEAEAAVEDDATARLLADYSAAIARGDGGAAGDTSSGPETADSDGESQHAPPSIAAAGASQHRRVSKPSSRSTLPGQLRSLVGHALMTHAKGRSADALRMLHEVVRQAPHCAEPYEQLSSIHGELGDSEQHLQYGMVAAYLNDRHTTADTWTTLGDLSDTMGKCKQAYKCYVNAVRSEPHEWCYHERRLDYMRSMALPRNKLYEARLHAARHMRRADDPLRYVHFVRLLIQDLLCDGEETRAIECYKLLLTRCKQENAIELGDVDRAVALCLRNNEFADAAMLTFVFASVRLWSDGGPVDVDVRWLEREGRYDVRPPLPPAVPHTVPVRHEFDAAAPGSLQCRLCIAWFHLDAVHLATCLLDQLLGSHSVSELSEHYLRLCGSLAKLGHHVEAEHVLGTLASEPATMHSAAVWLPYAHCLRALDKLDEAGRAYDEALRLAPGCVEATLSRAHVYKETGDSERALALLQSVDEQPAAVHRSSEAGRHSTAAAAVASHTFNAALCPPPLTDERILLERAAMEREGGNKLNECVTLAALLAPYMAHSHRLIDMSTKSRHAANDKALVNYANLSRSLLQSLHAACVDTSLFAYVAGCLSGVPSARKSAGGSLDARQLHDYCLRLCELLEWTGSWHECVAAGSLSLALPQLNTAGSAQLMTTFVGPTFAAAARCRRVPAVYELCKLAGNSAALAMRNEHERPPRTLFNAYGLVLRLSSSVGGEGRNADTRRYVKLTQRNLPGGARADVALAAGMLSGNASLEVGSYHHALGQYVQLLCDGGDGAPEPLLLMLVAVCFLQLGCKKDIVRRHDACIQSLAYFAEYEKRRGRCQETLYNMGRALHQMNILPAAMHMYKRALKAPLPPVNAYDLRPHIAYNLSLIYASSGNAPLARHYLRTYCTLE